ncbi:hypothetical protein NDU88_000936 [Pleurodeles waltl]|uniref:Uncharacterized protein n=1 Tax=Pleurodeles waltl TaxID=8319 RepID=A0AAV7VYZ3_PLEWA|nr:hypothetical protein NDU88_000936 [Pleurodeles waltl]
MMNFTGKTLPAPQKGHSRGAEGIRAADQQDLKVVLYSQHIHRNRKAKQGCRRNPGRRSTGLENGALQPAHSTGPLSLYNLEHAEKLRSQVPWGHRWLRPASPGCAVVIPPIRDDFRGTQTSKKPSGKRPGVVEQKTRKKSQDCDRTKRIVWNHRERSDNQANCSDQHSRHPTRPAGHIDGGGFPSPGPEDQEAAKPTIQPRSGEIWGDLGLGRYGPTVDSSTFWYGIRREVELPVVGGNNREASEREREGAADNRISI